MDGWMDAGWTDRQWFFFEGAGTPAAAASLHGGSDGQCRGGDGVSVEPVLCWWVEGAALGERGELHVHGGRQGEEGGWR